PPERIAERAATPVRTKEKTPRRADRYRGDERLGELSRDLVAVPRDAVLPVAVESEAHVLERGAVAPIERTSHLVDHGVPGAVARERGVEARHVDDAVVHLSLLGAPHRAANEH